MGTEWPEQFSNRRCLRGDADACSWTAALLVAEPVLVGGEIVGHGATVLQPET